MAPYSRTVGAIIAFLLVTLFVKFADLQLTYELAIPNRLLRVWMSLRFSWQEFGIGAMLLGAVLVWQRRAPEPRRSTRVALGVLRLTLAFAAAISVAGIKYYGIYHGHMMITDFAENMMWAIQLAASAKVFESASIRAAAAAGVLLLVGVPWLSARLAPATARRLNAGALIVTAVMSVVTWSVGRPVLTEAQLEPSPIVWFFWGPHATYVERAWTETLAPIGPQHRRDTPAIRPRNVILIVLESIGAHMLASYDASGVAGKRLLAQFGPEMTRFDQVFAGVPISDSTIFSMLTGRSPLPGNQQALRALGNRQTLPDVLNSRGFHTEYLMSGPRNALRNQLVDKHFDRAMFAESVWPDNEKYARLAWGPDDRVLFDDVGRFVAAQDKNSPPFFLVMYTSNAHYPYSSGVVPGLRDDKDPQVRHAQLTTYVVDLVTDFYASLKASGLADSTAVLVFGDHGEAFGEHRGNYVHSKELYRENLRVPMLLLHPSRLGLPPSISQLGSLDDVMPTVLDLLGVEAPPGGSGMSLLNDAPDRLLFEMTPFGPGVVGFRNREFFYSLSRTGRELLFNRLTDPILQRDIKAERPDVAKAFRDRLKIR